MIVKIYKEAGSHRRISLTSNAFKQQLRIILRQLFSHGVMCVGFRKSPGCFDEVPTLRRIFEHRVKFRATMISDFIELKWP